MCVCVCVCVCVCLYVGGVCEKIYTCENIHDIYIYVKYIYIYI